MHGTRHVIEQLGKKNTCIDYCLVGEPSCVQVLGDTIKYGRRGSLTGRLSVSGKQGHVAYPDKADNPIHAFARALDDLCLKHWDHDDKENFPPASLQFVDVHAGIGRDNVIPGRLEAVFNVRYPPSLNDGDIRYEIEQILNRRQVPYELQWHLSGRPFLSKKGKLCETLADAIKQHTDQTPSFSTSGGTSDGRFIAPAGAELAEFGPVDASIHQINEHVCIADLQTLTNVYTTVIEKCLGEN